MVDKKDIRKHRNDVIRLYQLLSPATRVSMGVGMKQDLKDFLEGIGCESIDMKSLGLRQISFDEVVINLKSIYGLEL